MQVYAVPIGTATENIKMKLDWKNNFCTKHKEKKNRKLLVCKNCSKSFFDKQTFGNYMRLYHEKPMLTCRRCGAEFAYTSSHYLHEKVCLKKQNQHDERGMFLWKDALCGKKCRTIKDCREHFLSHHGDENYMCESCGKSFKYRSWRNYHVKVVCKNEYRNIFEVKAPLTE